MVSLIDLATLLSFGLSCFAIGYAIDTQNKK